MMADSGPMLVKFAGTMLADIGPILFDIGPILVDPGPMQEEGRRGVGKGERWREGEEEGEGGREVEWRGRSSVSTSWASSFSSIVSNLVNVVPKSVDLATGECRFSVEVVSK